ncbi:MAG: helix-turn-helix domain-containing protein [Alishewanella aestuarii]
MKIKPICNSRAAQRGRLLQYLQEKGPITTLQARHELAVMHPAGRIKDLRDNGHPILTHLVFDIDSAGVRHRQGLHVLQAGGKHD